MGPKSWCKESGGFLEGVDNGMSTNWNWNRQTDRWGEKENRHENPILYYCFGDIKKPSELLEAWQSPFPVRWFQFAKIHIFLISQQFCGLFISLNTEHAQ